MDHLFDVIWYVIQLVLGGFIGLVALAAKIIHGKTEKTADDLAEFKTHVAHNYPTHDKIKDRFEDIGHRFDRLEDKINDKFNIFDEKLDRIINK